MISTKQIKGLLHKTILFLLVLLLQVACTTNEADDWKSNTKREDEISIKVLIPEKSLIKTVTDLDKASGKTHFEAGDAIGLFAVKNGNPLSANPSNNYINNAKLVYDGTDWQWAGG